MLPITDCPLAMLVVAAALSVMFVRRRRCQKDDDKVPPALVGSPADLVWDYTTSFAQPSATRRRSGTFNEQCTPATALSAPEPQQNRHHGRHHHQKQSRHGLNLLRVNYHSARDSFLSGSRSIRRVLLVRHGAVISHAGSDAPSIVLPSHLERTRHLIESDCDFDTDGDAETIVASVGQDREDLKHDKAVEMLPPPLVHDGKQFTPNPIPKPSHLSPDDRLSFIALPYRLPGNTPPPSISSTSLMPPSSTTSRPSSAALTELSHMASILPPRTDPPVLVNGPVQQPQGLGQRSGLSPELSLPPQPVSPPQKFTRAGSICMHQLRHSPSQHEGNGVSDAEGNSTPAVNSLSVPRPPFLPTKDINTHCSHYQTQAQVDALTATPPQTRLNATAAWVAMQHQLLETGDIREVHRVEEGEGDAVGSHLYPCPGPPSIR